MKHSTGFTIDTDFTGGNIKVERSEGRTVYVVCDLRDTIGDWFYWAFCVRGAASMTLTFDFSQMNRIGRFGPAVSHDLERWSWSDHDFTSSTFTYTFGPDEDTVWFAHDMLYHPPRFESFCAQSGLNIERFCMTEKGRELPCVRFGSGKKWILMTARHHACESTGSYVLEGMISGVLSAMKSGELPAESYSVLVVPFVDYDGVIDGDQGKNRSPYDQNRDYTDSPIYEVIRKIIEFSSVHQVKYAFDFHSPWHIGGDNDYVFISRSTESMEAASDRFSAFLMHYTEGNRLTYNVVHDVGPNSKWNNESSPTMKNYFSKYDGIDLSITLETPYFGLEETKISQDAMIELGQSFAKSVIGYINSDTSAIGFIDNDR